MANMNHSLLILLLIILFSSILSFGASHNIFTTYWPQSDGTPSFNVMRYGAKSDGRTDSTGAFVSAWNLACGSNRPAIVYVPPGRFLLKKVVFQGPCKNSAIFFRLDGTLVAPSDYKVLGYGGDWLVFWRVTGVTISGGTLEGQGAGLWACKASGGNCPSGAASLRFTNSDNIAINGLTSLNSQMFHIIIYGCHDVKIRGVTVSAPEDSPNTDGINVQMSTSVTILNSRIGTGDDCISIGPGTSYLYIENIRCGPGHGISIGSLGKEYKEPGVHNVVVKRVYFYGTQNGVRIKTWGRPSTGFVKNVVYQHVEMNNVQNPILVDQNYCPSNKNCPGQQSGVQVSDIRYHDISGTSATQVAVKFDCSKKYPCRRIHLENVALTYNNGQANAICHNAHGSALGFVQPSSCL
ncbi:polygalacturonase-like [Euphorbia lathyris]|uniref:polygalacturonase-like n=1 Tax=Euphorbia lathyris TaxID=212925 RepID=UPI003313A1A4